MTTCPSCRYAMTPLDLAARLEGRVDIDLCFSCQGIWFDNLESARISPGGIVDLFKLIHQHRDHQRLTLAAAMLCPRCDGHLAQSRDIVKSGPFNYFRCGNGHGRFVTFGQFMIEKGFVRQLSSGEVSALSAHIGVVHCSGCGAPVDIRKDSACPYCGSPIAVLDSQAVEKALAGYGAAEAKRVAPRPEALADAMFAIERERRERHGPPAVPNEMPVGDLILAGIGLLGDLLVHP